MTRQDQRFHIRARAFARISGALLKAEATLKRLRKEAAKLLK